MEAMLKEVKKITAGDQVYQNLRENIVGGRWKADERLPSETELAAIYGVNRLTVRVALQKLSALGLVETRVGDGSYVKKFDFSNLINAVEDLYSEPKLMDDVCEFRMLIEVECMRLAMIRATEEDFLELERINEEYETFKDCLTLPIDAKQLTELTCRDVKIHEQICRMSHNTLYMYCFMMARKTIEKYIYLTLQKRINEWMQKGIHFIEGDFRHRAILNAMKSGDFEQCKKLYHEMINYNVKI